NFTDMPVIMVTARATGLGSLRNETAISTARPDPNPLNNSAAVNVTSANYADLTLTKSVSQHLVAAGHPFTYTLQVQNRGPLPVPVGQVIRVIDHVPAGITLTAVSAPGWTCDALPFVGNGTDAWGCMRADGLLSGQTRPEIVITAVSEPGTRINNACVRLDAGPVTDPTPNVCGGVSVNATAAQADLRVVSKTASPSSVAAGQDLTYVITVDNLGPDSATQVLLQDLLFNLVDTGGFQSMVASQGSCSPPGPYPRNGNYQLVDCNLGTLAPGESATVTLVIRPHTVVTTTRRNTATVRSGNVGDPNPANNSNFVDSIVVPMPDLAAGKLASPPSARAGTPITYVASVANTGVLAAPDAQLTDILPANATFVDLVGVSDGGSCTPIAPGTLGGTLQCSWATPIAAGSQRTVTYRLRPLSTAAGETVVNSMTVATSVPEGSAANNSATTSTTIMPPQLDLVVNKSDSADPVDLGQSTTYTVTVSNSGPSMASNVVLTDVFPAPGTTPTAVFSYRGALTVDAGGSCTEPAIADTSGTVRCVFASLANGQTATVTYAMRAEALSSPGATTGTVLNQASVSADEPEAVQVNNLVTHDTTARRFTVNTDLQISKSGPAGPLSGGADLAYTLTVVNNGPLPSDGTQVIDILPAGLLFVAAPDCVHVSGTVSCNVGALAVGGSRSFIVNARLASPYTGSGRLRNTAIVDAPGDTNPANNAASAQTTVLGAPASIPTLSAWTLGVLSVLLAVMAFLLARRRAA
ncbi:MAG: IPTL-CTERM sorting domain-containing protein, partial [Burkholderiaceae bacterium]